MLQCASNTSQWWLLDCSQWVHIVNNGNQSPTDESSWKQLRIGQSNNTAAWLIFKADWGLKYKSIIYNWNTSNCQRTDIGASTLGEEKKHVCWLVRKARTREYQSKLMSFWNSQPHLQVWILNPVYKIIVVILLIMSLFVAIPTMPKRKTNNDISNN